MSRIKTVDQITPDILAEMFNQDLLAIRVPNYIGTTLCDNYHMVYQAKALVLSS